MANFPKTITAAGDCEYIRDLVRRDQERETNIEAIQAALKAGEESGLSDRTPEETRQAVRQRLRDNGQLPAGE